MPDGRRILAGCMDGTIAVFDRGQARPATVLEAHLGQTLAPCCITYDFVTSMGSDGVLRLWELSQLVCARGIPARCEPVSTSVRP